jgi:hypothetical protein
VRLRYVFDYNAIRRILSHLEDGDAVAGRATYDSDLYRGAHWTALDATGGNAGAGCAVRHGASEGRKRYRWLRSDQEFLRARSYSDYALIIL